MHELELAIQSFAASCRKPALSEAGEELLELKDGNWSVERRLGNVVFQAWDQRRNLVRKVIGIESQTRSKLVLRIERFAKRAGELALVDLNRAPQDATRQSARQEFREIFRRHLRREFPDYNIATLSTEPNLEQTLSPAFPRALLRRGREALAAIAAPPGSSADFALSFGLIWLDYLRTRERAAVVEGLVVFLPDGQEKNTCLRIRFLDPDCARYLVFRYTPDGHAQAVDLSDYGNTGTRLDPCRRAPPDCAPNPLPGLASIPGVETIETAGGSSCFRVRGLEFARLENGELRWGLETKQMFRPSNVGEIQVLATELARMRSADALHRSHPLFLKNPEAWLESQVRAHLEELDATLRAQPVYGQVPAFAGADRGVLDLLAVDHAGRLAVIELKASEDIHLPLQALDYWIRVKWHLDRGEFSRNGYFAGTPLRTEAPRLLLVAPALDFHPSNERVLRFFSPDVEVSRFGVGVEWRKRFKVMYRM